MYARFPRHSRLPRGFTLVELMVALTIGLLMAFGLVRVFASSSDSYRALALASQQIENGRYAIQVIGQDLQHAGYYGEFAFPAAASGAALPDPCETADAAQMKAQIVFHVQGYNNVAASPIPGCLSDANVVPGTDVLVIRRAGTVVPAALVANEVYIQATADSTDPANPVIAFGNNAASYPLLKKAVPPAAPAPAEIRKYYVIIYFVSPCNEPNGGGGVCTGPADDGGRPVPTLKRLVLGLDAGVRAMRLESVAEGIETLQIDYGVDTTGDGLADGNFLATPASVPAWGDVMSAQIHVLARTPEMVLGAADTKTYNLGTRGAVTPGGNFRRQLFTSQVRLVNPSGRREVP